MNIPDDVIDAGARAIYGPDWWEKNAYARPARRAEARAALSAALPLLALDRDTIARAADVHAADCECWQSDDGEKDETCEQAAYQVADAVLAASPLRSVAEEDQAARAMYDAAMTVKATGGAVEIHGVRIEPCDEYGQTREGGQP